MMLDLEALQNRLKWFEGEPDILTAGMVVEDHNGELLLIGHNNESGGQCDCCKTVTPEWVLRYAFIQELILPVLT